jgi:uncharacterized protein (TIGR00266 family)
MKYEIKGTPLPVVICELDAGESLITEKGSMSWMSPNMQMETVGGGVGKALGRMFSGESLFQNKFTAKDTKGLIAFASSFPGQIMALDIQPGKNMIVQKSAFLAAQTGVELSIHFQKKFGAGLFGGEGFIMQKLSGQGTAFVEIDGHVVEYTLQAGQSMLIDTGYLAIMEDTVSMDIETVKGLKNVFLGGEGLFNTKVTGPGRIWLQTMPISAVAKNIIPFIPAK